MKSLNLKKTLKGGLRRIGLLRKRARKHAPRELNEEEMAALVADLKAIHAKRGLHLVAGGYLPEKVTWEDDPERFVSVLIENLERLAGEHRAMTEALTKANARAARLRKELATLDPAVEVEALNPVRTSADVLASLTRRWPPPARTVSSAAVVTRLDEEKEKKARNAAAQANQAKAAPAGKPAPADAASPADPPPAKSKA